jgi:hypothetical protein
VAGCAPPTGSAGHAGATANLKLTFHLDHSAGADHTNVALAEPKFKARLADLGVEPMPMTPAEFAKFIADETEKWARVIRTANIKAE